LFTMIVPCVSQIMTNNDAGERGARTPLEVLICRKFAKNPNKFGHRSFDIVNIIL